MHCRSLSSHGQPLKLHRGRAGNRRQAGSNGGALAANGGWPACSLPARLLVAAIELFALHTCKRWLHDAHGLLSLV